ncbi:MAG: cupin domain-containing protein [Microthrixaceae bacterium]
MNDTTTLPDRPVLHNSPGLPDTAAPFVLARDEGEHRHFLNHVATSKVPASAGTSMTAVEFTMPKGFGPPQHVHESEDELMVILAGEIAFRSGDTEIIGGPGATVWLPHGVPHTFQVLTDEARCVAVTASSSGQPLFENMVTELGTPTPEPVMPTPIEIDPGEVGAACARNGIEVLGPPPPPLD